jgi:predicted DNA binding CopG/RHH family protein
MKKPKAPVITEDAETTAMLASFMRGEWQAIPAQEQLRSAAARSLAKDARVNIRLSSRDVRLLKQRAAQEGMPYQTLIASVLHKFVTGQMG